MNKYNLCADKLISGNPERMKVNFTLLRLYLLSILISVFGVLFYDNAAVTYLFVLLEVASLVYCFCRKRFVDYLGLYILYTGLSLEFGQLLNNEKFYSFKEVRIFGLNLGVLALLPLAAYAIAKRIKAGQSEKKKTAMHLFIRYYCLIWGIGIFIGIILSLFNDNNVNEYFNMAGVILEEAYERGAQPLLLFAIFSFLLSEKQEFGKIENYFEATLSGCVFYMMFSWLFGRYGYYGGVDTLIAPNNVRWVPLLLLLPFYKKYRGSARLWILGVIGAYFSLRYNATGKTIILYVLVPVIWLIYCIKNKEWKRLYGLIALVPLAFAGGIFAIQRLVETSVLFRSKFRQAQSLIKGIFGGEMNRVLDSPLKRFHEIGNIMLEFLEKPQLVIFGKGLGGTFIDRIGMTLSESDYSKAECSAGVFINVHETVAKLLLSGGIIGIVFLVWVLVKCIKNFSVSPWILLGVYWFLISYGYSITMTAIGLPCLLYSLNKIEYCKKTPPEASGG